MGIEIGKKGKSFRIGNFIQTLPQNKEQVNHVNVSKILIYHWIRESR